MKEETLNTRIEIASFPSETGISEYQAVIHITNPELNFEEQLYAISQSVKLLEDHTLKECRPVFKRYFVSDAANQSECIVAHEEKSAGAYSIIEQPPLDGSKIALWIYLLRGVDIKKTDTGMSCVSHNGYTHAWIGDMIYPCGDSENQAGWLLNNYIEKLEAMGGTLADNCIRTWFFVENIDVNYKGMVKGRNDVFCRQGLTKDNHFIASTGIAGRNSDIRSFVQLDAYALFGAAPEQIRYLYAKTHLNPTYEYGVSFERGTYVDYGDRRQVFISGTASINYKGEIEHVGDIRKQTERMWDNVEALLKEADMDFTDTGAFIVYLRDIADYTITKKLFEERFPDHPTIIVHAPVCRPQWLIEMECMGVKFMKHDKFKTF